MSRKYLQIFGWTGRRWAATGVMIGLTVIAGCLLLIEMTVPRHAKFAIAMVPAFHAAFGFGAFTLLVLSGWVSGKLLKRRPDYYTNKDDND